MAKCPRCQSPDTKFCYYNNYSKSQPRYFCKNCKRYWTNGGTLRNVPVGGGLRKNKSSKQKANTTSSSSSSTPHLKPSTSSSSNTDDLNRHSLPNTSDLHNPAYPPSPSNNYLFNPRIYETGDQSIHALSYHQSPQLYPGYNYPPRLAMETLQHHSEGGFGAVYTLPGPSRSQSNGGEASEVSAEPRSEAIKTAQFAQPPVVGFNERSNCDYTTREGSISKQGFHYEDASTARANQGHKENNDSYHNNNYTNMQNLGSGNELQQGKRRGRAIASTDGMLNLDLATMAHSEEGLTNVVNIYDWQQISEGLFGGAGDFFYMPSNPNWSDLDLV